jgi:CBS domain-containing protein
VKASDIMSAPVVSVEPHARVSAVAALLAERRISGVPVVEHGRVIGVIDEGDLLRRFEIGTERSGPGKSWWARVTGRGALPADYVKSHAMRARDVMTSPVICVTRAATIQEVASIFASPAIRRIPVLGGKQMVGIVTRADLVQAIAMNSRVAEAPLPQSDATIRAQLLDELEAQPWWRPDWVTLDVRDGVVHLGGLIESEAGRLATRVAAENVPGVRGVDDERMQTARFQPMF